MSDKTQMEDGGAKCDIEPILLPPNFMMAN